MQRVNNASAVRPLSSLLILAFIFSFGLEGCAEALERGPETVSENHVTSQDLFSGVWENDRGSQVTFINQNGVLSGVYQTNVGQPDKSQKFPLTGFAESDQITFTVNFKNYGSMTSWTGQLTQDTNGPYIRTLWHLTRDVPDPAEDDDLWKSITSGASEFRPIGP